MNYSNNKRHQCLQCDKPIVGRSDKKFCDTLCRNSYNNKLRNTKDEMIIQVNKILRKNRRILEQLNPVGKTTVRKEVLIKLGFNFIYFTHTFSTKKRYTYKFCYDYGYMEIIERDIDRVLIINQQPYMK